MAMTFPSNPTTGQQYSVSGGPTYTWDGTVWKILTPGSQFSEQQFTATAGQTSFTVSGGYVIGAVDVYRNGVKLVVGVDFLATDLSTVVLTNAASAGDTIEVVKAAQILYADAVKKSGDTITGSLNVTGGMGVGTASPDSDFDVNGGGQRLFKAKAITRLGAPNLGTYKGYLLLAKAYTSGTVDQSHVNGTFYLKRGGTGSGNRTDVWRVSSNTAYNSDNLFVQASSTASEYFVRTCKVTYGGIVYHAVETGVSGGDPDQGVWFTGTFANCAPVYVDASYVSSITDYGSSTNIWNADGAGNGSIMELNNGVFGLPKGQIKFPAAQNASADANTLDDYEEGTWTPAFSGGASNPTINGLIAYGYYTKVGNLVTLSWFTSRTSSSGGSGTLYISGLPFTSGSVSSFPFHGTATVESVVFGASAYLTAMLGGTSTLIQFAPVTNNATFSFLACSALNGGAGWFCGSISYRTA